MGLAASTYGYAGEQTDATGLQYLRARYYNPAMGRFVTQDTWSGNPLWPGSLNRWNYVQGNPITATDPTGHWCFLGNTVDFLGTSPCTTKEVAAAGAQEQAIGRWIRQEIQKWQRAGQALLQRSESHHLNPAVQALVDTSYIFGYDLWQTPFVKTPEQTAQRLFSNRSTLSERLDAAIEVWQSTGQPLTEQLLLLGLPAFEEPDLAGLGEVEIPSSAEQAGNPQEFTDTLAETADIADFIRGPEESGHSIDVQKAIVGAIRKAEEATGDKFELYFFKRAQGAEYWDRLGVPAKPEAAKTVEEYIDGLREVELGLDSELGSKGDIIIAVSDLDGAIAYRNGQIMSDQEFLELFREPINQGYINDVIQHGLHANGWANNVPGATLDKMDHIAYGYARTGFIGSNSIDQLLRQ